MDDAQKLARMLEGQQRLKFMQQMGAMPQMQDMGMQAPADQQMMGQQAMGSGLGAMTQSDQDFMAQRMAQQPQSAMQGMIRQPRMSPNMPTQQGMNANMPIKRPVY